VSKNLVCVNRIRRTLLARVQAAWPAVVGHAVAAEGEPVAERAGAVTVACRSSVWAHELKLLAPDIVARLNDALEPGGRGPLRQLRFRTGRS
jgi:predicted nucleic acid-binding Zn ribbon protein